MAGTISLSLSQQLDSSGAPLAGGLLTFYQAGTTTPQDAFQDVNLTIEHPNPITLDSAGRVPQFFLADGNIKIRLTDANGVVQIAQDNILVIGPSSGSGSGDTVDPTTIHQTGDLKSRYGTGVHTGWVRLNGRTIGSATSGATERANADCEDLFLYLYAADTNLAVSGGRGVSAAADWAANKTIALPDGRGRILAGLDDMGSSAASRLSLTYFGATPTVLGAARNGESVTLGALNLPPHAHTGTTGVQSAGHVHTISGPANRNDTAVISDGIPKDGFWNGSADESSGGISVDHTHSFTTGNGPGTSAPFSILPPMMLVTNYIKM